MKYYKANKKIAAMLDEIDEHEKKAVDEALKISRRLGGSRTKVFTSSGLHGDQWIVGFHYTDEAKVDKKLLKKCKKTKDCWLPRLSSKEGKAIQKELEALRGQHISELCKAINMKQFTGISIRRPAYAKHGDQWYVGLHDDVKPKGLTRISDRAYERARKADQD